MEYGQWKLDKICLIVPVAGKAGKAIKGIHNYSFQLFKAGKYFFWGGDSLIIGSPTSGN
jgi:hypothetical protein